MITIREWREGDEKAFFDLSMEWLEKYDLVEPLDYEILSHPHEAILDRGGMIYMACDGEERIGTVSMVPMENGNWEIAKLGVTEKNQKQGIGRRLMDTAIAFAREKQCRELVVLTNSRLLDAIRMYHGYGFVDVPPGDNIYESADMEMVLLLQEYNK